MTVGQVQRANIIPRVGDRFASAKRTMEANNRRVKTIPTDKNYDAAVASTQEYNNALKSAQNLTANYIDPPSALFSNKYDDHYNYPARQDHQPPPNPKVTHLAGLVFMSKAFKASIYNASALPAESRMPPLSGQKLAWFNKMTAEVSESTREQRMMSARAISAAGWGLNPNELAQFARPSYLAPLEPPK